MNFFSRYFVIFALLLFCMFEYGIRRIYGFSIYPDEFGYWASAAQWAGFDWSETVSKASYYSFGYSLILMPILLLCKNGVSAYRAALLVNVLLQCLSIGLLYGGYRRLFCMTADSAKADYAQSGCCLQEMKPVFAVGAAVFYPVWTFYTQMTLTEALLAFLYVLICWLFARFLEKPVFVRAMLLSIALIYLHFVHMRTVGVVIAAGITLLLHAFRVREARKPILAAALFLAAGALIGMQVRDAAIETLYLSVSGRSAAGGGFTAGNEEAAANAIAALNGYAVQIANARTALNPEGILLLLKSCAGKLYYLGMSSFGMIYPAIGLCIGKTAALLRDLPGVRNIFKRRGRDFRKEEKEPSAVCGEESQIAVKDLMYVFQLLSFCGQFLISAVYMRSPGRLDGIVYGRYNDYLVPVLIGIGLLTLWENRHFVRHVLVSIAVSTALFAVSLHAALHSGAVLMHGCHALGLNYISDDLHFYEITPEFVKAFAFGLCLLLLMTGCIAFVSKAGKNNFGFSILGIGIILLMEVLLTFRLNQKYLYFFNEMNYYDLEVYEYLEDYEKKEKRAVPVSYLYDGGQVYINLIQFSMREKPLYFIEETGEDGVRLSWEELETVLPAEGFLITDCENDYLPEIERRYRKCVESRSGGFTLFLIE